ncbi:MAG: hypothetical protein VX278_08950, partial [Myxococcota bacterium]|nr:hypothetical protein [Myxococcota bacterium]
ILQNWVDWKDKLGPRPAVLRFEQQVIPLLEEECRTLDSWEDLSEAERNRWLQSDFLFILDEFSALYSSVCCWNFDGEEVAFSIKQGMERYLYQDINRSVQKRGWFQLDVIIPFDTEFDNDVHQSVDVDRRYDCEQKIVRVDHVGLKSMEGHPMRIARVVISA